MKLTRLLAILLMIAMLFTSLVACNSASSDDDDDDDEETVQKDKKKDDDDDDEGEASIIGDWEATINVADFYGEELMSLYGEDMAALFKAVDVVWTFSFDKDELTQTMSVDKAATKKKLEEPVKAYLESVYDDIDEALAAEGYASLDEAVEDMLEGIAGSLDGSESTTEYTLDGNKIRLGDVEDGDYLDYTLKKNSLTLNAAGNDVDEEENEAAVEAMGSLLPLTFKRK